MNFYPSDNNFTQACDKYDLWQLCEYCNAILCRIKNRGAQGPPRGRGPRQREGAGGVFEWN